jgi:hypothetical protein
MAAEVPGLDLQHFETIEGDFFLPPEVGESLRFGELEGNPINTSRYAEAHRFRQH